MKKRKPIKFIDAWHFLPNNGMTRYSNEPIWQTKKLTVKLPLEMCEKGLHASIRAIDALRYAPGEIICRVRLSGKILHGDDKLCAQHREVLWMADATHVLHQFATDIAESALLDERKRGREPHAASWEAIRLKRAWLRRDETNERLSAAESAAESAARSAAESAAESAARSAAESAAWSAAESAAWSAAESAAWSAAWSAARSAARSAAWSAAESAAESAALSAAESAARSAAWSAAESAAWSAANDKLEQALYALNRGAR